MGALITRTSKSIEVEGDLMQRDKDRLLSLGFRKSAGRYSSAFSKKVYRAVLRYFESVTVKRGPSKSNLTLGEVAPINMKEAFREEEQADDLFSMA